MMKDKEKEDSYQMKYAAEWSTYDQNFNHNPGV